MNAERLKGLVENLLADERELGIQACLDALNNALSNFASAPQESAHQVAVSKQLADLEQQVALLGKRHDTSWWNRADSIGARDFFSDEITTGIKKSISENPMTPAVVQQHVNQFAVARRVYLDTLTATEQNLNALGISSDALEEGSAEIAFQLPRHLFQNELNGLIDELRAIRQIVRAFSELAGEAGEQIEVRQISTTDPQFFFGLNVSTIILLGAAVNWALERWKQVEEIRNLRAETRKNKSFTEDEIKQFYDNKIEKTISEAIAEKVVEFLGDDDGEAGRRKEQHIDVKWALESLFARIERGMTVEIRCLPPPKTEEEKTAEQVETSEKFETLQVLSQQLAFPPPDERPILQLPPVEPNENKANDSD